MKKSVLFAACCSLVFGAAADSRVYGDLGGSVRLSAANARIYPHAFNLEWGGGDGRGKMFAEKDGLHHWTIHPNGKKNAKFDGTLAVEQKSDTSARFTWRFVPDGDITINELCVSAAFKYSSMRGGAVMLGNKKISLPDDKPKNPQIAHVWADVVQVLNAAGDVCATFKFDKAQSVLVQDGRAWNIEGFSLRFSVPKEKPCKKGKEYTLAMTYESPEKFKMGRSDPIKIVAGADWIPMAPTGDVIDGSALDFSKIRSSDSPAGKYGRVIAKGATFEFENLPGVSQRFYGVNLCGNANTPPTYEDSKKLAARLRKIGYNAVRFHHHEATLVRDTEDPGATKLNHEMIKRFDGLVAACVENGIYMTTDLFVSRRPIKWRAIGVDRDGDIGMGDAKAWLQVHEGMQSNLFAFVRNWFNHVNEYTGRRLADEPAMAWISLVNEAAQGSNFAYLAEQQPWVDAWKKWLAAKKVAEPQFYGEIDEAFPTTYNMKSGPTAQALMLFMQETESAFAAKVTKFLREEIGCKALLTNLNGCFFPLAYQYCKEKDYDFVDDHFYVDHPSFLEQDWALPSKCPNVNPIMGKSLGVQILAHRRVLNRPFTITEYNYSAPGRFRGVGGIATGALGALQGWNGLWRFAWSHDSTGILTPEKKSMNYFDMSGDPLGLAGERASVCLFLRRDLPELEKTYAVHLPTDLLRKPNAYLGSWTSAPFTWAGWYAKLGTQIGDAAPEGTIAAGTYPDVFKKTREETFKELGLRTPEDGDFPRAGDGTIRVDNQTGDFTIITPKTCGGFSEEGPIRARALTVELEGAAATVWASSLDDEPLATSKHILVTHLTDVQNTGITYLDESLTVMMKWGRLPHLMRNGRAKCKLRVGEGKWHVHALHADGSRRGVIPSAFSKGCLTFTAQVDTEPWSATYLYELVRE